MTTPLHLKLVKQQYVVWGFSPGRQILKAVGVDDSGPKESVFGDVVTKLNDQRFISRISFKSLVEHYKIWKTT